MAALSKISLEERAPQPKTVISRSDKIHYKQEEHDQRCSSGNTYHVRVHEKPHVPDSGGEGEAVSVGCRHLLLLHFLCQDSTGRMASTRGRGRTKQAPAHRSQGHTQVGATHGRGHPSQLPTRCVPQAPKPKVKERRESSLPISCQPACAIGHSCPPCDCVPCLPRTVQEPT